jgi:hypothetical protein
MSVTFDSASTRLTAPRTLIDRAAGARRAGPALPIYLHLRHDHAPDRRTSA